MAGTGRRAQRSEESRKRILEATLEIAAEHGYEGTTIAMVSERSGLPTGSVYWHFESKDRLFGALLEHCVTEWEARQDWSHLGPQPSRERFETLVALRTAEASGPASFWRLGILLALERRLAGTAARQTFLDIRRTRLADIAGWWEELLPGRVRAAEPGLAERLAQFTMATADGLCVAGGAGEAWDHSALAGMLIDALRHLVDDAVARSGRELPRADAGQDRCGQPESYTTDVSWSAALAYWVAAQVAETPGPGAVTWCAEPVQSATQMS